MPDYLGDEMRKVKKDEPEKEEKEKEIKCEWKIIFNFNYALSNNYIYISRFYINTFNQKYS